jgi:phage-related protein
MSNPVMPLADLQVSAKFNVSQENTALATNMEGGYVATRPRHTRRPRKTWTSGFTNLTEDQKNQIQAFFDSVYGGSVIFDWTNPADGSVVAVRFTTDTTLQFSYSGAGATRRYDTTFKLQEA